MLENLYLEAKKSLADIVICDYYVNANKSQMYVTQGTEINNIEYIKMLLGFFTELVGIN